MTVWIYSKEHLPAHCHVFYEGEEAIVNLITLTFRRHPPYLNDWELEKILGFVREHRDLLLSEWQRITRLPAE